MSDLRITYASSAADIATCLAIRIAVFVREQQVPLDEEADSYDSLATHYLAVRDGGPVGTARLAAGGSGVVKVGRVAVVKAVRGTGVGAALMRRLIDDSRESYRMLVLDAQESALAFYEVLGFRPHGDLFVDGGIKHRRMSLDLRAQR